MADRPLRCAIYARKSTEDGLEQEFNSLDAQREACAAYILSQKHEGWQLCPEQYDDGGYSGGNMERPALKQLMAEVRAGGVDVVVVYKVDRLTRSLADFAKIVEVLDKAGASFVSVTQAFNTPTSMGRLTLNVLLSFAQFEREVTSERIRDKVAASKAKGMWMGGPVPLGYDLQDRKLIINNPEAATIRHIFQRYAVLRSVGELADELADAGIRTKFRRYKDGRTVGDIPFQKGPLAYLLKNRLYIGEIDYKGQIYAGQHPPIIDRDLWQQVQAIIEDNRVQRRIGSKAKHPSLLTGLLFDPSRRPMSPTYAVRDARRYRYYVTRPQLGERLDRGDAVRVPAGELERTVVEQIARALRTSDTANPHATSLEIAERIAELRSLANTLEAAPILEQRAWLLELDVKVQLADESLRISFDEPCTPREQKLRQTIKVDAKFVDRGSDIRLMISPDGSGALRQPDPVLVKLIVQGFAAREEMLSGKADFTTSGYSDLHRNRLARLSYLAPDIISAIIDGRHPPSLNGRRLLRAASLPYSWAAQRTLLGFA